MGNIGFAFNTNRKESKMKVLKFLILGIALLLGSISLAGAAGWEEIKAGDLKARMDSGDVLVINPLSKIEFNDLHITGSVNIPIKSLEKKLPQDKNTTLAFYCLGRK